MNVKFGLNKYKFDLVRLGFDIDEYFVSFQVTLLNFYVTITLELST